MSIISSLREYLLTCPLFENIPVTVDFLATTPTEGSIEGVPVPYVLKSYTDGSSLCRYQFIVAMRFPWIGDGSEGLRSSEWFEQLSDWFDKESDKGNLPVLPPCMTAVKIQALPNRFGFDGKNSSVRYQMICGLTFFKRKDDF